VLLNFFRLVARFRRQILVAEVILAVAHCVALISIVLAVLAAGRYRPATLDADPEQRIFDTPASPIPVFVFTTFLAFEARSLADSWQILQADDGSELMDVILAVLIPVLLALLFVMAWRSRGVRLRPDGLLDRQPFGSLFVPWEAFDIEHPVGPGARNSEIALSYQRPDLVRRRGVLVFSRRAVRIRNVDWTFFAWVIRHYVSYPGHRPAIGSEAELRRLTGGAVTR
jgi:hypothetical protein